VKSRTALFLVALLLPLLSIRAQNPYISHFTTTDGLSSNTVYYLFQDSKKFIWMATDAGVIRYDGSESVCFNKNNGLSCNEVLRIDEDSSGRIWCMNLNGTVNYILDNRVFNEKNSPGLNLIRGKEYLLGFFEDKTHAISFYNRLGEIITLQPTGVVDRRTLDLFAPDQLTDSTQSLYPRLRFISKSINGFFCWTGWGVFYVRKLEDGVAYYLKTLKNSGVFRLKNNHLYLVENNDKVDKFKELTHIRRFDIPVKKTKNSSNIKSVLEDRQGLLWVATFDSGIYCMRNNTIIRRLAIEQAQSVIEDHEGNIWISSMKDGVYKIEPELITHRHFGINTFRNYGIRAMAVDSMNGIWLTNGRNIYYMRNNRFFRLNSGETGNSLNQVVPLTKAGLIAGEQGQTYYFFRGFKTDMLKGTISYTHRSEFSAAGKNSSSLLKKIILNKTRDKIISFGGNGLLLLDPVDPFTITKVIGVGSKIFNAFFDMAGDIIINADVNYRYRNNSLELYSELTRFNNMIISGQLSLNDSVQLLTFEGDSTYLFYNHTLYHLKDQSGLPMDRQIRKIIYQAPFLFLVTSNHIFSCENPVQIINGGKVFLKSLGISFRNIHDIVYFHDSLVVASDDGLTIIPAQQDGQHGRFLPKPYFTTVLVDDSIMSTVQPIVLNSKQRLQVNFGSVNYSGDPVFFSYKLEGINNDWVNGSGTAFVFKHLPLGSYTFLLRARLSTSAWSEPVCIPITVSALFWQLPLFYIILFLILTGLVILMVLRRKNQQLRKQETANQLIILEQKALLSMMNPHFIFNALGSIQGFLLHNKGSEAGHYLSQFARLIRQNLNAIKASSITIDDEAERLTDYLGLEKLRMENRFEFQIEVDPTLENEEILIPSMIIQPFVENAIWHGISSIPGKGQINISFHNQSEKEIRVLIEDNGVGITKASLAPEKSGDHLHMGVEMTRKRLDILAKKYRVNGKISWTDKNPGQLNPGTVVTLVIPVISGGSEQ
jgi:two-component sensor histidine kinase